MCSYNEDLFLFLFLKLYNEIFLRCVIFYLYILRVVFFSPKMVYRDTLRVCLLNNLLIINSFFVNEINVGINKGM